VIKEYPRVALFPCVYHEVDGVAKTSKQFESFARNRGLPLLLVHAGPQEGVSTAGSVTHIELRRSLLKFPIDRAHYYDPLFWRHYRKLESQIRDFRPDLVQITGPSDVGMLGTLIAHRLKIPLAATWQTNVHQYARSRAAALVSFLPDDIAEKFLDAVQRSSFRATARFYRIPRLLFAPNQEMIQELEKATGKPCYMMSHAVDTDAFSPAFRNREAGPFRIGYVGRLTAEKNVRVLARLEEALLAMGHRNFEFVVVGQGAEEKWLREHMKHAEFTGVLTGRELSQTFANLDLLAFPSETDTFGLVVLEAFASGVPAVVTGGGGPKFTVRHGQTGYAADTFDEFASYTSLLMSRPDVHSAMCAEAREQALATSWNRIFEGMYEAYGSGLLPAAVAGNTVFDTATT
jgi:glycosyltransferase involved in cell wall biosynthesis